MNKFKYKKGDIFSLNDYKEYTYKILKITNKYVLSEVISHPHKGYIGTTTEIYFKFFKDYETFLLKNCICYPDE